MENAYLPDYMLNNHDTPWFQALANNIERKNKSKIEWTASGPMLNGISISYQFMYPPIFHVQMFIDKLNAE